MNIIKKFSLAGILCLFVLFPSLSVRAAGETPSRFSPDKSWDEMAEELVADFGSPGIVALGCRNTVTGEEHFYNGDEYIACASLCKVSLNMYFAEQIAAGTLDWDDQIGRATYREIQESSLIYSKNETSVILLN